MSDALCALKYSRRTADRYFAIVDRFARFLEIPLVESGMDNATRYRGLQAPNLAFRRTDRRPPQHPIHTGSIYQGER
jgi:hypothetical protein